MSFGLEFCDSSYVVRDLSHAAPSREAGVRGTAKFKLVDGELWFILCDDTLLIKDFTWMNARHRYALFRV